MKLTDIVFNALELGTSAIKNNIGNPMNLYSKLIGREQFAIPSTGNSLMAGASSYIPSDASGNSLMSGASSYIPLDAAGVPVEMTIFERVVDGIKTVLGILFSVLFACLVANHMIMHPPVVRIIAFIVTLFFTLTSPIVFFGIALYYALFAITRYYFNTTFEDPTKKKGLLPYIFALLPATTYMPQTTFAYILLYPFIYDMSGDSFAIRDERKNWMELVNGSFPNIGETMKVGQFKSLYTDYAKSLDDMHTYTTLSADGKTSKVVNPFITSTISVGIPVGATGTTGSTNATGTTGSTGSTGSTNATGATGATGSTNATGATGATGSTNSSRSINATGTTGSTNATGATGATNSSRSINATGATGSTNATNATNSTNSTNTKGSIKSNIHTGPTGTTE